MTWRRRDLTSVRFGSSFGELVEDVKVALVDNLAYHAGLFQQVVCDIRSHRLALAIELQLEILAEARRVVIS